MLAALSHLYGLAAMAFKLTISVKPNARRAKIEKRSATEYVVWVSAPAREGRANDAVVAMLAEHFAVPKSSLRIVRGERAKRKTVEIA